MKPILFVLLSAVSLHNIYTYILCVCIIQSVFYVNVVFF